MSRPLCEHGFELPPFAGKCQHKVARPEMPRPKDERILAISEELLEDLMRPGPPFEVVDDYRIPAQAFNEAYQKLKRNRLAIDYGMSPLKVAKYLSADEDDGIRRSALQGVLDVLMRDVIEYAKQFHVPMLEGDSLDSWINRVEDKMRGPQRTQAQPFLAMVRAAIGVVMATADDDELDKLIKPLATPCPCGCGSVKKRTGCSGLCCSTTKPAPGRATLPGLAYKPGVMDPTRKVAVSSDPTRPKDNLLNPRPKGFAGASSLPFDSDYD